MRDSDFAYAVARIRSNENKLFTQQDIDSLLFSESYESCTARLADKGWGTSDSSTESDILGAEQDRLWALIEEILPESNVFDSLKIPNDYHNIKAALKARMISSDWEQYQLRPVTVSADDITAAVQEKDFSRLPGKMAQAAAKAYDALVSWGDGQLCDMLLDSASLEDAIASARPHGGVLLEFAELNAYRADIRVAVRCARMKKSLDITRQALAQCSAVDAEKLAAAAVLGEEAICSLLAETDLEAAEALNEGLSSFEQLCDARMDKRLEFTKYTSLGVEPIVSYIHARQKDMRSVRIILAGLRNSVPAERIRELL